jgi:hypothetical protein
MSSHFHRQLLHIYDASNYGIRATAWARRHESLLAAAMIYPLPIEGGWLGLRSALDDLVSKEEKFSRVLFETHGNVGEIFFDDDSVNTDLLTRKFTGRGYEKIFPLPLTRMYFNGCYIADQESGWVFLETAGKIFLHYGGNVFAQTGAGRHLLGWTTLTGHIIHFGSTTCHVIIAPGGNAVKRYTD